MLSSPAFVNEVRDSHSSGQPVTLPQLANVRGRFSRRLTPYLAEQGLSFSLAWTPWTIISSTQRKWRNHGIVRSVTWSLPVLALIPSTSGLACKRPSVEKEVVLAAAKLLLSMGASKVFVFGLAISGELRPDSDVDMAVSGLPARVYFSAVSRASDLVGRPVDLVDLDDDTPLVRYLLGSGELLRVG